MNPRYGTTIPVLDEASLPQLNPTDAGRTFFDSQSHKLWVFDGSEWRYVRLQRSPDAR